MKPWEKYAQEKQQQAAKPWEKYKNAAPEVLDIPAAAQTALESFGNVATLNYLPHLQAMVEKALPDPTALSELKEKGFSVPEEPSYTLLRDENIKRLEAEKAAHPVASGFGTAAGLGTTLLVPGGAVARAASLPAKIAAGAAAGAGLSAVSNPGDKEGEFNPIQFDERKRNAMIGAGVGAAVPVVGAIAGPAAQAGSKWLKNKAAEKAVAATGAMLKDMRKQVGKGTINEMGRDLLDAGAIPWLATPKRVLDRLGSKIDDTEAQLSEIISSAAERAPKAGVKKFSPTKVAAALKNELRERYSQVPEEKLQAAFDEIDSWLSGQKPMSIDQVQKAKIQMNRFLKETDFAKAPSSMAKEGTLAVRRAYKEGIENIADDLAEKGIGQTGAVRETNRKLGSFLEAQKIAQDRVARDAANRAIGLTDTISGGAGATVGSMVGGPVGAFIGGAAGTLGNKFGRSFGRGIQARGADSMADVIAKLPLLGRAVDKNPAGAQALANRLQDKMSSAPSFKPFDPESVPPGLFSLIEKRPELIDELGNEKLKQLAREHLARKGRSPSAQTPEHVSTPMSEDKAREMFLKGN